MRLLPLLVALTAMLSAQPKTIHHQQGGRLHFTVPFFGTGKLSDPIRPMITPATGLSKTPPKLSFSWLPSDDKKSVIVEFISTDKATLAPIRAAANAPGR